MEILDYQNPLITKILYIAKILYITITSITFLNRPRLIIILYIASSRILNGLVIAVTCQEAIAHPPIPSLTKNPTRLNPNIAIPPAHHFTLALLVYGCTFYNPGCHQHEDKTLEPKKKNYTPFNPSEKIPPIALLPGPLPNSFSPPSPIRLPLPEPYHLLPAHPARLGSLPPFFSSRISSSNHLQLSSPVP